MDSNNVRYCGYNRNKICYIIAISSAVFYILAILSLLNTFYGTSQDMGRSITLMEFIHLGVRYGGFVGSGYLVIGLHSRDKFCFIPWLVATVGNIGFEAINAGFVLYIQLRAELATGTDSTAFKILASRTSPVTVVLEMMLMLAVSIPVYVCIISKYNREDRQEQPDEIELCEIAAPANRSVYLTTPDLDIVPGHYGDQQPSNVGQY